MKRSILALAGLALAASMTVLAGASAAASPAAVSLGPSSAAPPPAPHVVNLHSAFARTLPHVRLGRIAGIVPPRGKKTTRARALASGCTEPNCNLAYHGGLVQHSPHVYLLLWGDWSSSAAQGTYNFMYSFYNGLGVTTHDSWSTVTSQYGDGSGNPAFGSTVFASAWQDTSAPPNPVTPNDLAAEAYSLISAAGITDLTDAQVVVASAPGTCFNDGFAGSCGVPSNSTTGYCAWHDAATGSSGNLPFVNLPFILDAGADCGENWINSSPVGIYDGLTTIAGHEYAETITDPFPFGGWSDPADTISDSGVPGEIGDKCAWAGSAFGVTDPAGDVTLSTGTYAMQSLWSNAYGRCMMTSAPTLTVANPGNQRSTLGRTVSLQVQATTNTGLPLSYSATGLPPGLRMSANGHITGSPSVTAGTWSTHVRVADALGAVSASFSWAVSSVAGPVKGFDAKCADDSGGSTKNGNKIDLWTCTGKAPQRITFAANGQLQVVGKCIIAGTRATLQACAGTAAQTWTRLANSEYVIKSSGRCLTDPGSSKTNGTWLTLAACKNTANQHWSLP